MADNDQNEDEYKFVELDSLDNEGDENTSYNSESSSLNSGKMEENKNIKQKALILVGVVVFAMLMYHFIGGMFSKKSTTLPQENSNPTAAVAPTPTPQPTQSEIAPEPIQPQTVQENNTVLEQKVISIETTQQQVQSEVSSVSQQVGNVNNNVNALSSQITRLNQVIDALTAQVAKQSAEINLLMDRTKPKIIKRPVVRVRQVQEPVVFYINAVIPGRAWLIGTNGSTLTVREGTNIAGYGVVKLIDSMSGRVLTSSGRVIRFSQEDS